jgi:pimeloyl-ACP methyl ester carboxylesterase
MTSAPLPSTIHTIADATAVEAASRRHEVRCGDGAMVWHCWGEGRPVVLLHGGSGSWTHWIRNVAALVAAGRQAWIPDLPGFGDSARPPAGGDADALPEPVEAAMAALLGDVPVDLVGFSFGSMVAAFIAAQHPARVRRLVLSGAPALGIRPVAPLVLKAWGHLPPGPELDAVHRENLARLMLAKSASIDDLALAIHAANLSRDRMRMRRISRTDILLRTLPGIRCPVFGIWGEEDVLYRGVQHLLAPALAAAPDFRGLTMIPGAGHWVQFEDAPAFDRALAEALAG